MATLTSPHLTSLLRLRWQEYMRARERAHRDTTGFPPGVVLHSMYMLSVAFTCNRIPLQFYNYCCVFVYNVTESTNSRIFWFSILEMLIMVAVSAFQVDY